MDESGGFRSARARHAGDLQRNLISGPTLIDLNFSVLKSTSITERIRLQFRAEFFNLMNHSNYGAPNQTVFTNTGSATAPKYSINPTAGLISTLATTPRQIQFGLKLMF